jgi:hypothetical protein
MPVTILYTMGNPSGGSNQNIDSEKDLDQSSDQKSSNNPDEEPDQGSDEEPEDKNNSSDEDSDEEPDDDSSDGDSIKERIQEQKDLLDQLNKEKEDLEDGLSKNRHTSGSDRITGTFGDLMGKLKETETDREDNFDPMDKQKVEKALVEELDYLNKKIEQEETALDYLNTENESKNETKEDD